MSALRLCWLLTLLAAAQSALAQNAALHTFIACPTYRDTDAGRKSGCWLADDPKGVRYDVTLGPVKPQVGRLALIEGVRADEPERACGGAVLAPVRVAVLDEECPRQIITADTFPGRPFKAPAEMLAPSDQPRSLPVPPFAEKSFSMYFEYGRDFLIYQHAELVLEKVALYARASQAPRVRVEGFAATEPLKLQGRVLREPIALAKSRAEMVAEALRRLGVSETCLVVSWHGAPVASKDLEGGKLPEPSKRRVVITVTP